MNIDDVKRPSPALVRQLVGEQVSQAPSPHPWPRVAALPISVRPGREPSPPRSRVLFVAVAASFVALLGALVLLGSRDEPDAPSDTPAHPATPAPIPLADVTDVADDQWVVPTEVPGEMEFQYAMRTGDGRRSVRAGTDATPELLTIHLEPAVPAGAAPDFSTVPIEAGFSEVRIGGRQWAVTSDVDGWHARPLAGSPSVVVHGSGSFSADAERLLGSLQVVPTELLPYPPLNPDGPMIEVAEYEFDGERWEFTVDEVNGYYCTRITETSGGASGSCGGALSSGVFASFAGGGGYTVEDGASVIRAEDSGVVRDDVARVEVEFIDGSVVSVEPTNPTDRFEGLRFWVVVADVRIAEGRSADNLTPVREIRAFDAADELLDTQRPVGG
jgi:hypothetical protein